MNWLDELQDYWHKHHHSLVHDEDAPLSDVREKQALERKKQQLKERKGAIVHATSKAEIVGCHYIDRKEHVRYGVHHSYFIKQKDHFYIEEWVDERKAVFANGQLMEEKSLGNELFLSTTATTTMLEENIESSKRNHRFRYDRLQAVKYAEQWWNSYHPDYPRFDVDCTNYVSQCLHAGGAPMRGYPNRSNGWWYQNNNWSYSWSVAHALRWYLSGSETGLTAEEVSHAQQLEPGDIICYDFDGDGKWQHNTVVVAKDEQQMPLVNAHTTNSRMRYWAYEDSTAWTENIQYKFFHINDI